MRLALKCLWVDSDGMIQVEVSLEGCGYAATQDVYVYPDTLQKFGQKLQSFPVSVSDEAVLEIGSTEESSYCWLKLCAYVYDRCGHSALELSVQSNGLRHVQTQSKFSVPVEAASLNELGKQIESWATINDTPLIFERSDV